MSGVPILEVTDLAHVDAWLHARAPRMNGEQRIRIAARITVERRGETLLEAEVDTYLVPAPFLPADDDAARAACDAHEKELHDR